MGPSIEHDALAGGSGAGADTATADTATADDVRRRTLTSQAIVATDVDHRIDRVLRLAQRLFDVPVARLEPTDGGDALQIGDEGRPSAFSAGWPVRTPDGTVVGTLRVLGPEPRELGEDEVGVLQDLAELIEGELSSQERALLDDRTGLVGRRGFHVLGRQVLAVAQRSASPCTLLTVVADGPADVPMIEAAARVLRDSCRSADVVARVEGAAFAVLLTGAVLGRSGRSDLGGATVALDRVRDAFAVDPLTAVIPWRQGTA